VHQKLVDIPSSRAARQTATGATLAQSVSLSWSYMSLRTFQESDAEKSDQDLVVDVANEVRDRAKLHSKSVSLVH